MFDRYDRKLMAAFDDERGLILKPAGGNFESHQHRFELVHRDWSFVQTTYYREAGIKRTFSKRKNADGFRDKTIEISENSYIVHQFSSGKMIRGSREWSEEIRDLVREGLYYIDDYSLGEDKFGNRMIDSVKIYFTQVLDSSKVLPLPYSPPRNDTLSES